MLPISNVRKENMTVQYERIDDCGTMMPKAYTEMHLNANDNMIVQVNRELFYGQPSEAMQAHFEPELIRLVCLRRAYMTALKALVSEDTS